MLPGVGRSGHLLASPRSAEHLEIFTKFLQNVKDLNKIQFSHEETLKNWGWLDSQIRSESKRAEVVLLFIKDILNCFFEFKILIK